MKRFNKKFTFFSFSEKETLGLTYEDKIQLVALWKQVSNGRYSESKMPDIGYFDVIGNDRRFFILL